jgi:Tol biopolymer transport system component
MRKRGEPMMVPTPIKLIAALALSLSAIACTPFKPSGEFSDIRGKVMSLYYDAPLANATISIPSLSTSVKTDEQGNFYLNGLPTQWLEAEITHPSHFPMKRQIKVEPFGTKYLEIWADTTSPAKTEILFEREYDIWKTDIHGMKQVNLTGTQNRRLYRTNPVWTPKKDKIGYIAFDSSTKLTVQDGVWTMAADGTMPRQLTSVNESGRLYYLDWSADGNQFAFMLQDRIFVYNQQYGTLKGLNNLLARAATFGTFNMNPSWTPNGQQLVFSNYVSSISANFRADPNQRQIFIMDKDGGDQHALTRDGDNYGGVVSHDGKKIAYISSVSGQPELYLMDINGSNPRQITYLRSQRLGSLRWTQDDGSILFNSDYMQKYKSLHPQETWVVDRDGSHLHMVSNDALHPDG